MLALVGVDGPRLDPGSVGLALARRWSSAGERVLFVDADATGSRLAERLGAATRAEYSPLVRGLPSLIAARQSLTVRSLAAHCYSLDDSEGSLWALFAPFHPSGAEHAANWLANRVEDLMALDGERRVVLASSMRTPESGVGPLLRAASTLALLAPVETSEQAAGLRRLFHDPGLMGLRGVHMLLIVDGTSPLDNDKIGKETGMHVAGRLRVIDDKKVLRLHGGRRGRAFARELDKIASHTLTPPSAGSGDGVGVPPLEPAPTSDQHVAAGRDDDSANADTAEAEMAGPGRATRRLGGNVWG